MSEDTQVKVAIFASSTPDYFFNHFHLSQASDFPATPNAHSTPAWVELVPTAGSPFWRPGPASAPPAGSSPGPPDLLQDPGVAVGVLKSANEL
jgi:hypothetical protein